jgi:putative membrane protein insertion efficiency factor
LLLFFGVLCGHVFAGQNMDAKEKHSKDETAAFVFPIQLYRNYISKVDGNRCQMEPTCSTFCITAIEKHGFLLGWIMCSDRLVRCGRDERKISPSIWTNGQKRVYDPVSNNDFWWHNPK